MVLRSILESSRFEIITSKRVASLVYGFFGLLVLGWWVSACTQFITAYIELGEFDIDVPGFFFVTIVLFLPLALTGAYLLSLVLLRWRLHRWFKQLTAYPQYITRLSPAEAGLIEDYEYSLEEVHASLLNMHFRNVVRLSSSGSAIIVQSGPVRATDPYEQALLGEVLGHKHSAVVASPGTSLELSRSGSSAHKILLQRFDEKPLSRYRSALRQQLRIMARILFCLAGFTGVISMYSYLFHYETVNAINYPRYPVVPGQIYLLILISLLGIAVLSTGFWPRFAHGKSVSSYQAWLEASGFKQYLSSTYRYRLSEAYIDTQQPATIRYLLPFMVAYKLVPLTPSLMAKVAKLT